MAVRGIRGAISVEENSRDAILSSTEELLNAVIFENDIEREDVASIFFSMTDDLDAVFPAVAARSIGFVDTALFCMQELPIQESLERCIRVLVHLNTEKSQSAMRHVYLRKAIALRPDIK